MDIRFVKLDDKHAVSDLGVGYIIDDENRGVNDKFWLKKENGTFQESYLVKFSTRKVGTISDLNLYNEVVCSRLCERLGLKHVDYEFCEFVELDGTVKKGVICQSYKEDPNWIETNGRALHESFGLYWYDNNNGIIPKLELNTVYAYIEEIKTRFQSRRMTMSEETENRLIDEMDELAVFDFGTCQIDRHWRNVTWINNNMYDDRKFKVGLVPIYDNECSFLLDDITEENLQKLIENIRNPKKKQVAIDMVNKKRYNSPYLGIRTSLVRAKEDNKWFLVPRSNDDRNLSNATILSREIAQEAHTRPAIRRLCDKMLELDIEAFLDELEFFDEENSFLKEIYAFIWNTRMALLKESMINYKNNLRGENVDEKGAPLF